MYSEIKTDSLCTSDRVLFISECRFRNHHDIINQHSALKHKDLVLLNNSTNNCKSKTQFSQVNRKEHHWEHL